MLRLCLLNYIHAFTGVGFSTVSVNGRGGLDLGGDKKFTLHVSQNGNSFRVSVEKVTSEDSNFNFYNLSCFAKSHITPPALSKISVKCCLLDISLLTLRVNRFKKKFFAVILFGFW